MKLSEKAKETALALTGDYAVGDRVTWWGYAQVDTPLHTGGTQRELTKRVRLPPAGMDNTPWCGTITEVKTASTVVVAWDDGLAGTYDMSNPRDKDMVRLLSCDKDALARGWK